MPVVLRIVGLEVGGVAPQAAEVTALARLRYAEEEINTVVTRVLSAEVKRASGDGAGNERVRVVEVLNAKVDFMLSGHVGDTIHILPGADLVLLGITVSRLPIEGRVVGDSNRREPKSGGWRKA